MGVNLDPGPQCGRLFAKEKRKRRCTELPELKQYKELVFLDKEEEGFSLRFNPFELIIV